MVRALLLALTGLCSLAVSPPARADGNWKIEVFYAGTVTTVSGPDGPVNNGIQGHSMGRNDTWDLANATNNPASTTTGGATFTYDPVRKRLNGVTTLLGGQNYTVSYAYYGDGKMASMTSPVGTTTYSYDAAGRLVSMTNPHNEVTAWTYDHAGRVLSETTTPPAPGVPIQTAYTYGVSGQGGDPSTSPAYLRTITQRVNGQVFWTYTLTHSYLGQLKQQTGAGSDGTTESAVYAYDNRGRLTSDANQYVTGGQTHSYTGSYHYDLANNLRGGSGGWTHNSNNQVTVAGQAQGGGLPGMTGLAYDFAGNLTSGNGMTLAYDPFGRRVSKTVGGRRPTISTTATDCLPS